MFLVRAGKLKCERVDEVTLSLTTRRSTGGWNLHTKKPRVRSSSEHVEDKGVKKHPAPCRPAVDKTWSTTPVQTETGLRPTSGLENYRGDEPGLVENQSGFAERWFLRFVQDVLRTNPRIWPGKPGLFGLKPGGSAAKFRGFPVLGTPSFKGMTWPIDRAPLYLMAGLLHSPNPIPALFCEAPALQTPTDGAADPPWPAFLQEGLGGGSPSEKTAGPRIKHWHSSCNSLALCRRICSAVKILLWTGPGIGGNCFLAKII
jgi:hypothetical protein